MMKINKHVLTMMVSQLLWLVTFLDPLQATTALAQAILNPQCTSIPASIWVKLVARPPQQGPIIVNVNFENYVIGVLEGEMSQVPDIPRFENQALRAGATAIRTWGAYFCRKRSLSVSPEIYGVCDTSSGIQGCYDQEYFPGHSDDVVRYGQQVIATAGIHLRYNNTILDAQHRANNGDPTNPLQDLFTATSYPYLKSVPDPVSAGARSQIDSQSVGLSQVGSNRWASGVDPSPNDAFHPKWTSYRQILSHYYTEAQVRTSGNQDVTPANRWVPLRTVWNTANGQAPLRMNPGEQKTVTVWIQNTGTTTWIADGSYYFAYETYLGLQVSQVSGQAQPSIPVSPGRTFTATVTYTAPNVGPTGCIGDSPFFQMYKEINGVGKGFDALSIEDVNLPWPGYFETIYVGNGCKSTYLPAVHGAELVTQ